MIQPLVISNANGQIMDPVLGGCMGALIGATIGLAFNILLWVIQIAFWIVTLPIRIIIYGLSVLGPIRSGVALTAIGGIVLAVVLTNPELTRQANQLFDEIGLDIDLSAIDVGDLWEDVQDTLQDRFPGTTTEIQYRVVYDRVRGRSCPQTSCSVEAIFERGDLLNVVNLVNGDVVSSSTTWLEIAHSPNNVYVHSSLAEPVEIIVDIPTSTPEPEPIPTPFNYILHTNAYYDGAYTRASDSIPEHLDVMFINGVDNDANKHAERLQRLQATFENAIVGGIFNDTNWYFTDSRQAHDDLFEGIDGSRPDSTTNPAIDSLVTYLARYYDQDLTIMAHSQGAAIVSAALRQFHEDYQNRSLNHLTIYTFGGFAVVFPEGPRYRHCVFERDRISGRAMDLTNETISNMALSEQAYYKARIDAYELERREFGVPGETGFNIDWDSTIFRFQHNFVEYLDIFNTTYTCTRYP